MAIERTLLSGVNYPNCGSEYPDSPYSNVMCEYELLMTDYDIDNNTAKAYIRIRIVAQEKTAGGADGLLSIPVKDGSSTIPFTLLFRYSVPGSATRSFSFQLTKIKLNEMYLPGDGKRYFEVNLTKCLTSTPIKLQSLTASTTFSVTMFCGGAFSLETDCSESDPGSYIVYEKTARVSENPFFLSDILTGSCVRIVDDSGSYQPYVPYIYDGGVWCVTEAYVYDGEWTPCV